MCNTYCHSAIGDCHTYWVGQGFCLLNLHHSVSFKFQICWINVLLNFKLVMCKVGQVWRPGYARFCQKVVWEHPRSWRGCYDGTSGSSATCREVVSVCKEAIWRTMLHAKKSTKICIKCQKLSFWLFQG